ncbi:MAG: RDD family protein, partial [Mesorhizobium sp.]
PLVLLVSLFADRKRTLHDLLLGTVVSRSDR